MREKDNLDLLIDSALATYADPGPDSGLENRVLAALSAVRTESPIAIIPRPRRWLPWAIAVPVAAGLLLVWLSFSRNKPLPEAEPQQARQSAPIAPPAVPSSEVRRAVPRRHPARISQPPSFAQTAQAAPLPKLDVFPTPQPLTAEERALVVVVTETPLPAREALIEAQSLDHLPIRIAEIHIPPLEPPDQGQP